MRKHVTCVRVRRSGNCLFFVACALESVSFANLAILAIQAASERDVFLARFFVFLFVEGEVRV